MTAAIICNGDFPKKPYPRYMIEQCDVVICCDGGLRAWLRAYPDRLPDKIVGDMDSLSGTLRKRFADRVVHYNLQKYKFPAKIKLRGLRQNDERQRRMVESECNHVGGGTVESGFPPIVENYSGGLPLKPGRRDFQ